jgi:hypothetical protein
MLHGIFGPRFTDPDLAPLRDIMAFKVLGAPDLTAAQILTPWSYEDFMEVILTRSPDAALGPASGLSVGIILESSEAMQRLLMEFLNLVQLGGRYPGQWKEALICPVPKQGTGAARQIALMKILPKISQARVGRRVANALEVARGIREPAQGGFRSGCAAADSASTLTQTVDLAGRWRAAGLPKGELHMVALNLERAFQAVPRWAIRMGPRRLGSWSRKRVARHSSGPRTASPSHFFSPAAPAKESPTPP